VHDRDQIGPRRIAVTADPVARKRIDPRLPTEHLRADQLCESRRDVCALLHGERCDVCPADARVMDLVGEVASVELAQLRPFVAVREARLDERGRDRLADATQIHGVQRRAHARWLAVVGEPHRERRGLANLVTAIRRCELRADARVSSLVVDRTTRESDDLWMTACGRQLCNQLREHAADRAL
jgi:hypothetical protein